MSGHQQAVVIVIGIFVAGAVLIAVCHMLTDRARAKYGARGTQSGDDDDRQ